MSTKFAVLFWTLVLVFFVWQLAGADYRPIRVRQEMLKNDE